MKKYLVIILLIVITVFSLTACGSSSNSEDTIKVAIDLKYPPFMYMDSDGNPAGLEPEIAKAFGEYLGKNVEIINTDFSMLVASLDTGEADIVISDMSVNEARMEKVDFSDGYRFGRTPALVNKEFYDTNGISNDMPADVFFNLEEIKCIGLAGTVGTTIPQMYGVDVNEASEIATALIEITSGSSNVLVGSYVIFGDHAANPDTTELYLGIPEYATSAFAVKKGNTELLKQANAFIKTMYEEGGLYDQLAAELDDDVAKIYFDDSFGLKYIVTKPE